MYTLDRIVYDDNIRFCAAMAEDRPRIFRLERRAARKKKKKTFLRRHARASHGRGGGVYDYARERTAESRDAAGPGLSLESIKTTTHS